MPAPRVLVPLRWSDMDAYGHVNNVQFLRLLEDARVALFAGPRFGVAPEAGEGVALLEGGLIVARAEIEYRRPLEYRVAPVAVDVRVSEIRGAQFTLGYTVTDPEGVAGEGVAAPVVYAVAETTMVPYDLAAKSPRRLLPEEVDVLKSWWDSPVAFRRRGREAAR
ncbi:MAG: thioesterase family protein [Kineosporiaceae bacterium]